ncbi:MAG: hypothetical protein AMXMBFR33_56720 [Candidatus Xenobia bacterium]|jgi:hypothetical protein
MRHHLFVFLIALFLCACSSAPPKAEGAIHPDKIPIYPKAAPDPGQSLAGADLAGDDGAFYSKYFDFKTADPPDKVRDWYKTNFSQAKMEEDTDLGQTLFTWSGFPGAEKGESITIVIEKEDDGTLIRAKECLKAGKHKRD